MEDEQKKSWSFSDQLKGMAAVITAIAALIGALHAGGFFNGLPEQQKENDGSTEPEEEKREPTIDEFLEKRN